MRFYLDAETATWFRRVFLSPVKQTRFPKTYVPLLKTTWQDQPPHLDFTKTRRNGRFVKWVARRLRREGSGKAFGQGFRALADRIDEFSERGVIDLLGDLVDTGRTNIQPAPTKRTSLRERALKHLGGPARRMQDTDDEEDGGDPLQLVIIQL